MNNNIELRYNFQQVDNNVIIVISVKDKKAGDFIKTLNLYFKIENEKLVDITQEINEKIMKAIMEKEENE